MTIQKIYSELFEDNSPYNNKNTVDKTINNYCEWLRLLIKQKFKEKYPLIQQLDRELFNLKKKQEGKSNTKLKLKKKIQAKEKKLQTLKTIPKGKVTIKLENGPDIQIDLNQDIYLYDINSRNLTEEECGQGASLLRKFTKDDEFAKTHQYRILHDTLYPLDWNNETRFLVFPEKTYVNKEGDDISFEVIEQNNIQRKHIVLQKDLFEKVDVEIEKLRKKYPDKPIRYKILQTPPKDYVSVETSSTKLQLEITKKEILVKIPEEYVWKSIEFNKNTLIIHENKLVERFKPKMIKTLEGSESIEFQASSNYEADINYLLKGGDEKEALGKNSIVFSSKKNYQKARFSGPCQEGINLTIENPYVENMHYGEKLIAAIGSIISLQDFYEKCDQNESLKGMVHGNIKNSNIIFDSTIEDPFKAFRLIGFTLTNRTGKTRTIFGVKNPHFNIKEEYDIFLQHIREGLSSKDTQDPYQKAKKYLIQIREHFPFIIMGNMETSLSLDEIIQIEAFNQSKLMIEETLFKNLDSLKNEILKDLQQLQIYKFSNSPNHKKFYDFLMKEIDIKKIPEIFRQKIVDYKIIYQNKEADIDLYYEFNTGLQCVKKSHQEKQGIVNSETILRIKTGAFNLRNSVGIPIQLPDSTQSFFRHYFSYQHTQEKLSRKMDKYALGNALKDIFKANNNLSPVHDSGPTEENLQTQFNNMADDKFQNQPSLDHMKWILCKKLLIELNKDSTKIFTKISDDITQLEKERQTYIKFNKKREAKHKHVKINYYKELIEELGQNEKAFSELNNQLESKCIEPNIKTDNPLEVKEYTEQTSQLLKKYNELYIQLHNIVHNKKHIRHMQYQRGMKVILWSVTRPLSLVLGKATHNKEWSEYGFWSMRSHSSQIFGNMINSFDEETKTNNSLRETTRVSLIFGKGQGGN